MGTLAPENVGFSVTLEHPSLPEEQLETSARELVEQCGGEVLAVRSDTRCAAEQAVEDAAEQAGLAEAAGTEILPTIQAGLRGRVSVMLRMSPEQAMNFSSVLSQAASTNGWEVKECQPKAAIEMEDEESRHPAELTV